MKKKINWLNHSVSFAVVLTGILLAFQLSQCSEDRKQQKTIENHKNGLLAETYANKESLKYTLEMTESNLVKADTLIALLKQGKDLKKINSLSIDLLTIGGAYFKKNAYNVLVESGDIRFMKDFEGKTETIILYEDYKIVNLNDDLGFQYSYTPYYQYVMNHFDIVNSKTQKANVYLSKKFMNLVGTQQYFLTQRIASYKRCQKKMEEYLALIEKPNP